MSIPDTLPPAVAVPAALPAHVPALFVRAMGDTRLSWRARGISVELVVGHALGQEPRSVSCAASATFLRTPSRPPEWGASGRGSRPGCSSLSDPAASRPRPVYGRHLTIPVGLAGRPSGRVHRNGRSRVQCGLVRRSGSIRVHREAGTG